MRSLDSLTKPLVGAFTGAPYAVLLVDGEQRLITPSCTRTRCPVWSIQSTMPFNCNPRAKQCKTKLQVRSFWAAFVAGLVFQQRQHSPKSFLLCRYGNGTSFDAMSSSARLTSTLSAAPTSPPLSLAPPSRCTLPSLSQLRSASLHLAQPRQPRPASEALPSLSQRRCSASSSLVSSAKVRHRCGCGCLVNPRSRLRLLLSDFWRSDFPTVLQIGQVLIPPSLVSIPLVAVSTSSHTFPATIGHTAGEVGNVTARYRCGPTPVSVCKRLGPMIEAPLGCTSRPSSPCSLLDGLF